MKLLLGLIALCSFWLCTDRAVYILSRLYEGAFFYFQYDYSDLKNEKYYKRLSYGEKIVCLKEDYSDWMEECLKGKEPNLLWVFAEKKSLKTLWVADDGKEYIIKRHVQRGLLKNLFKMGRGVSVWNNLYWSNKVGLDVVKPVAFSERRTPFLVQTLVIYRFEGRSLEGFSKEEMKSKILFAINSLRKRRAIHADLRPRNIVYTKGEDVVKFIDVDLLHFYPSPSYVCMKRLTKEESWLQKDYE